MKNIRVTFRLSPEQLARGLQIVRQLEPTYKLTSLNELVKTIYHNYIDKMTLSGLNDIQSDILNEIINFKGLEKQLTLEELMTLQK